MIMLTLKECRKLVDPKNKKYSDKELSSTLELINNLASIVVKQIKSESHEEKSCNNGKSFK